jgi:hypothetical protein
MRVFRGLLALLGVLLCLASNPALARKGGGAAAPATEEAFLMADVGATVVLPSNWKSERWADWDFKAKTVAGDMAFFVFMTPYQVPITVEHAKVWAESYKDKVKENKDIKVLRADVGQVAGRTTAIVEIGFTFPQNNMPGIWKSYAFNGAGKVIHVSIIAAGRNQAKAFEQLDLLNSKLQIGKPAAPLGELAGEIKTESEFVLTAAEGWRRPLPEEQTKAEDIAAKTGQASIDYKRCVLLLKPHPIADPDIVLFCNIGWHVPYTDERTWKDVEAKVYEKFFRSGEGQIPHAEKIEANGRLGFLYMPTEAGAGFRMSVIPYNKGIVVGWGITTKDYAAGLDGAFREMVTGMKFLGSDNGAQVVGMAGWIGYYIRYKPWHPLVWAPTLLILVGLVLGGRKMFSKPTVNLNY